MATTPMRTPTRRSTRKGVKEKTRKSLSRTPLHSITKSNALQKERQYPGRSSGVNTPFYTPANALRKGRQHTGGSSGVYTPFCTPFDASEASPAAEGKENRAGGEACAARVQLFADDDESLGSGAMYVNVPCEPGVSPGAAESDDASQPTVKKLVDVCPEEADAHALLLADTPATDEEGLVLVLAGTSATEDDGLALLLADNPAMEEDGLALILADTPALEEGGLAPALADTPATEEDGLALVLADTRAMEENGLALVMADTPATQEDGLAPALADTPATEENGLALVLADTPVTEDNGLALALVSDGAQPSSGDNGGLPRKDDPHFSKYFQMIRSRVSRWLIERFLEVDDRDPAIIGLDPNKSLASQVDNDEMRSTDVIDTNYSTNASLVSAKREEILAATVHNASQATVLGVIVEFDPQNKSVLGWLTRSELLSTLRSVKANEISWWMDEEYNSVVVQKMPIPQLDAVHTVKRSPWLTYLLPLRSKK